MPCCIVATPDRRNFGNLVEVGALQVWNSEAYHEFRRQLASDAEPEICRACAVYQGMF